MDYRLIDTHCHFDFPPFTGNETDALKAAQSRGVESLIVPAICAERFEPVIALSRQYSAIYAALGLHPIYISQHNDESLSQLTRCLQHAPDKLVAVGEIGLDDYIENPEMPRQIDVLQQQLRLAKGHDLPVILHSRRTHDALAQQLRRMGLPRTGVVHGFSGSLEQAKTFIKLGYYIGVGGVITYERAQKTRKTVAALPLSSLVLETDAPDMPLSGFQGQPNRPERIVDVLSALSRIRPEPKEQIAEQIYLNTRRLFNFSR